MKAPFPIDAVYTWVNGSDPDFLEALSSQDKSNSSTSEDTNSNRFADYDQLLYSLRSIEKYAPWIRNIFIGKDDIF